MSCNLASEKFSQKSLQFARKKSSARASGYLKLPLTRSPFSRKVLTVLGSLHGPQNRSDYTHSIDKATPAARCCRSANTPGHRMTDHRVRETDRAAARTSREDGDGLFGSFKRPQARALAFLNTVVTWRKLFRCRAV